jgi:hypothetical protein
MERTARSTIKKLTSLSALGTGALALAPAADASIIAYNGPPITLSIGSPAWHSGDNGSLQLPSISSTVGQLGFAVYQCGCGDVFAAVLGSPTLWMTATLLPGIPGSTGSGSYYFLKLVNAGVKQPYYYYGHSGPIASFQSVSGGLLSGGNGQFQDRFALFSFEPSAGVFDYGWVELSMRAGANPISAQLTIENYAYDDSGALIAAGEVPEPGTFGPTAIGALALGAVGLRRWRAARKKAA